MLILILYKEDIYNACAETQLAETEKKENANRRTGEYILVEKFSDFVAIKTIGY